MNILLDTYIVLWVLADSTNLTASSRRLIDSSDVYVSSISLAEIEIKRSVGKLEIADGYRDLILESGLYELPYAFADSVDLHALPFHHKDPFDRMLICQAKSRSMTILTADAVFLRYTEEVVLNS